MTSSSRHPRAIVSPHVRIRCPDDFRVGAHSIIDDFCYFSTRAAIGRCCHIASGCSVAGGREQNFRLGDFSSLSSGVKIWCASDDFVNDLVTIIPPDAGKKGGPVKDHLIRGDVVIGRYTAVGANTVVMPGNKIPAGTVIGALSFVPASFRFKPWSVYAGIPIRLIGKRNRAHVLAQARALERSLARGRRKSG
jgi:acetyltransferase-like isoleucine patch superfamily enzyme